MSGEAFLSVFALPFIIAGVAAAGAVLGAGAIAAVTVKALAMGGSKALEAWANHEEKKRVENERWLPLVDKCKSLNDTLKRIDERGKETYKKAENDLKISMECLAKKMSEMDFDLTDCAVEVEKEYRSSFAKIAAIDTTWMTRDTDIQNEIAKTKSELKGYISSIEKSLGDFEGTLSEREAHEEKISGYYLVEGQKQFEALKENYVLDRATIETFSRQLAEAKRYHNNKNYQSSIAITSTLQMNINEKIYDLETEKIAFEMALQHAKDVANSTRIFLDEHKTISKDIVDNAKKESNINIPRSLIGTDLTLFSERNEDGIDKYSELQNKVAEICAYLDESNQANRSAGDIMKKRDLLVKDYLPGAMLEAQRAMDNLANYYVRVSMTEDFDDYLQRMGIVAEWYESDDGKVNPLDPIRCIVRNENYSEKVAFEICPSDKENSRLQCEIKYHLIEGNPDNEARNEYYQKLVNDFLSQSKAHKKGTMKCKEGTKGKISKNVPDKLKGR